MADGQSPAAEPSDAPGRRDLVSVGSALVDHYYRLSNLPEPDGGAFVRDSWDAFGGVGGNVASAASRLGRSVGLVARLGNDGDAEAVLADLRERGIDTARVVQGEEASTYSLIFLGPDGERMVVTGGESTRNLDLVSADGEYLRNARAVFATAYVPDRATAPLVAARRDGACPPLCFDLSGPLAELQDRGTEPETVEAAVGTADLFVAGEVALRSYCQSQGIDFSTDRAVGLLRDQGLTRGALTAGEAGALLVTPDRTVDVPAFDVSVVDATGAGDAFVAGLIDAWVLDDRDPWDAGRHAAAVAALNCTGEGARGGLPTREAVQRFRERRE